MNCPHEAIICDYFPARAKDTEITINQILDKDKSNSVVIEIYKVKKILLHHFIYVCFMNKI